jgi:peroxiredoxin
MALEVGERAPNFTLAVRPKQWITLNELNDDRPVVLLFFPLAFSGVCTQEMCSLADDYAAYKELGAEVVGISVDSPYVNVKFAEACNASFPILSDFNKEAITAYRVRREDLGGLKGVAERAAFVVDREGRIAFAWQGENPGVMPPLEEIKTAIRKLNASQDTRQITES